MPRKQFQKAKVEPQQEVTPEEPKMAEPIESPSRTIVPLGQFLAEQQSEIPGDVLMTLCNLPSLDRIYFEDMTSYVELHNGKFVKCVLVTETEPKSQVTEGDE